MIKVITYGTYDLLHYGHLRLLERAKALGDYLIVGVTADDFDKSRGKINVKQSLMERIEAIKATGLADEIIIEEYEGQKIDDIKRYDIDIFTVGSDWVGKFDYLKDYCEVIYLERTEGVSSSIIRSTDTNLKLGLIGDEMLIKKYYNEACLVNGVTVAGICTTNNKLKKIMSNLDFLTEDYDKLIINVDMVYIASHPTKHYEQSKKALLAGKHVLCESPIALTRDECSELFALAKERGLVLMDSIKTAYSTAYNRLLLLLKGGKIGRVVSVDVTCTSLKDYTSRDHTQYNSMWGSLCAWGPTAMLPIFQTLGCDAKIINISSMLHENNSSIDLFTKADFVYDHAVASFKIGKGVKSEGELIISGTKGYIYVPAPWWITDYFEVRYENAEENKRYFYQLDGEGIRYEFVAFVKSIETKRKNSYIEEKVSENIAKIIERFNNKDNIHII